MQQSTIDNVKLEQKLNSNSKADGIPSSPNNGNTLVGCCMVKLILNCQNKNMKYDKLFADFEGRSVADLHNEVCYADWDGMHSVKYGESWDWVMPVWVKFRDYRFAIDEETKQKLHLNYVARLAQDVAYGTLEEVCHNLSIAINWLNTQVVV